MFDVLYRESIYLWYYLDIQFRQIAVYWALGLLAGSVISVFGKEKTNALMERLRHSKLGFFGILPAALLGAASPLCMYGTVPIVVSLIKKGMREDWAAAFMMCSILLNPQLIIYTAALGNTMVVLRIVSGLLCGTLAGILVRVFFRKKPFYKLAAFEKMADRDTDPRIAMRLLKNIARNIRATGPYFLIGILLAALFQRYVPTDAIDALFGRGGLGVLVAATIGVPMYVCGGGNIPLIGLWMTQGMTMGGALAFMTSGQAMKITNLGAIKTILGAKNFALYIVFTMGFAFLSGLLIDLVL